MCAFDQEMLLQRYGCWDSLVLHQMLAYDSDFQTTSTIALVRFSDYDCKAQIVIL